MKVLILGGAGYIGSAIKEFLEALNIEVSSIDIGWFGNTHFIDYRNDFAELKEAYLHRFNVVILAAAHISVQMCETDKEGAFRNNVINFFDLVNKLNKKQKFIYMSSSCVYVNGINCTEHSPTPMIDMLSLSKTTIDKYIAQTDVEYYGLRLGSVSGYSPNLRIDLMFNAMVHSAITQGKVQVRNPDSLRPILLMQDLLIVINTIINIEDKRGIYNVCSFNTTIGDLAGAIGKFFNVFIEELPPTPTYNFSIDDKKIRSTFEFNLPGDLLEGKDMLLCTLRDLSDCIENEKVVLGKREKCPINY